MITIILFYLIVGVSFCFAMMNELNDKPCKREVLIYDIKEINKVKYDPNIIINSLLFSLIVGWIYWVMRSIYVRFYAIKYSDKYRNNKAKLVVKELESCGEISDKDREFLVNYLKDEVKNVPRSYRSL